MKLFCAADLHLGRVPSRLPAHLPFRPGDLSPRAAWHALIDACLTEGADALLLAGDLIDDDRDMFEAYADLEQGVRRLEQAGTEVIAVAGNHDARALPSLADALPGLELLGRGGRWEARQLGSGPEAARIVGWSFPSTHVPATPIGEELRQLLSTPGAAITIGLIHGDLDAGTSRYAPLARSALTAAGVDAWLLGHVHTPAAFDAGERIGYLGSLSATDPGESGRRCAWLIEVGSGGLAFQSRSVAPLRYDELQVDLSGVSEEQAPSRLIQAVREHLEAQAADPALLAVALQIRLLGRVERPVSVLSALNEAELQALTVEADGRVAFVHSVRSLLEPPLELERWAQGSDPIGVAARTLATLRGPASSERDALVRDASSRLAAVRARSEFATLAQAEVSDEQIVGRLEAATLRLLATLVAQREEASR